MRAAVAVALIAAGLWLCIRAGRLVAYHLRLARMSPLQRISLRRQEDEVLRRLHAWASVGRWALLCALIAANHAYRAEVWERRARRAAARRGQQ